MGGDAKYGKRILVHYFDHLGLTDSDNAAEIEAAVDDIVETAVKEAKKQIIAALGGKIDPRTDKDIVEGRLFASIRGMTNRFGGYDEWDHLATDEEGRSYVVYGEGVNYSAYPISEEREVAALVDTLNFLDGGIRQKEG